MKSNDNKYITIAKATLFLLVIAILCFVIEMISNKTLNVKVIAYLFVSGVSLIVLLICFILNKKAKKDNKDGEN